MDIYDEIGVRKIINARAVLGRYGDSLTAEPVLEAMAEAARWYVNPYELAERVGERIAEMTGNEAAMVCAGASAGGLVTICGCMTGLDSQKRARLPQTDGMSNQVIMHRNGQWGELCAVRPSGCRIIEIEGNSRAQVADALEAAITEKTATIFMMAMARKSKIPVATAVKVGRRHNVPVVVEAAYDIPPRENLWHYTNKLGVDAVIFSGGKALRGPASTGLVVGRRDIIKAAAFNNRPGAGPGFAAKVGKEEIAGLYAAIKHLLQRDEDQLHATYQEQIDAVLSRLGRFKGIDLKVKTHGKWGDECGVLINVDPKLIELETDELYRACAEGEPCIEVGPRGRGVFINVATLRPGEEQIVIDRLHQTIESKSAASVANPS